MASISCVQKSKALQKPFIVWDGRGKAKLDGDTLKFGEYIMTTTMIVMCSLKQGYSWDDELEDSI